MGRGGNYFNNNRGVSLQSSKKSPRMIACQYGAGCTRSDCIYSHPSENSSNNSKSSFVQSNEPCMAFLAGSCAFTSKGCRKRHPSKEESQILIAKYSRTRCKFGDQCLTNGCLYLHPWDQQDIQCNPCEVKGDSNLNFYGYQAEGTRSRYNNISQSNMTAAASSTWGYDEYYAASYNSQSHFYDMQGHTNLNNVEHSDLSANGRNLNAKEFVPLGTTWENIP